MLQRNVGVSWGELNLLNHSSGAKNSRHDSRPSRQCTLAARLLVALAAAPLLNLLLITAPLIAAALITVSLINGSVDDASLATNLYHFNQTQSADSQQEMSQSQSVTSLFTHLTVTPAAQHTGPVALYARKSRYKRGLVCKDKGWEFCATWATSGRAPGSRIA
ncbi:hypothetical protein TUM4438_36780 [Shewanella sairae]|uniref:Uncharacterized protein n=1 Tax=Shewanella sairae TaxID=190310 RepID=A0ABQ4PP94_9GAMM|nr:hypothetical protein [Shewanella sairae]MCL1130599.1 hypothetical protein [Shewanella sairae]GIU50516.1 hypothetical protein TUM4438_36780 [Shewanella sairae]